MKLPLLFFASLVLAASAHAQTSQRRPSPEVSPADECRVSGMVIKLAGSEPAKSANVQLLNADDRTRAVSVVTDAGGRFELKGVAPGRYRLRVAKPGFVTQQYGQRKPTGPGAILALGPGRDVKDLVFRLIPSAVIAGRVINEEGDPLPWVQVSALRQEYSSGKRGLASQALVPTNDLGEYRLFGLPPGRYFIRAEYKPGQHIIGPMMENERVDVPDGGEQRGYVPMYYPGTSSPAQATAITVTAGEEAASLEILLRPVVTFSVRGRVLNLVKRRSDTYAITLVPRSDDLWPSLPERETLSEGPDNNFTIQGVLPGSYSLSLLWTDEGRRYYAFQNVEVGNSDIDGANLVVDAGITISGRVVWDGKPAVSRDPLTVLLRRADGGFGGARATTTPGGAFALPGISDGDYRVSVFGQSQDSYLKSVRYGSVEGLADGFPVLRGANATLEVTLSSRGARVQGTVVDSDNLPAAGVWVVLVPDTARRSQRRPYKQATTDQYGHFELRGIAPGQYKLFSWEDVEDGAWQDPDFLKPFEDKGEKVDVEDLGQKTVNLVAISSESNHPKP